MTAYGGRVHSRGARIGLWVLAGLLAVFFAAGALGKLAGNQGMIEAFQGWGYPAWLVYVVGAGEIGGAVLLLIPAKEALGAPLRFWGAACLSVIMVGAAGTHVVHAEYGETLLPAGLLVVLLGVAWAARPRGNAGV